MKVRWFGEPWQAIVCRDSTLRTPVPRGRACVGCDKPIGSADQGLVMAAGAGSENAWVLDGIWVVAEHVDCVALAIEGGRAS